MLIKPGIRMLAASLAALALIPLAADRLGAESSDEYVFKVAVENRIEERLYYLLKDIAGTDNIVVIASAQVETDIKKKSNIVKEDKNNRLVLPGVPVKKEIGKERKIDDLPDVPPSIIERLSVTILLDEDVPDNVIDTIRDIAIGAIGYNPDRGDLLNVRKVEFRGNHYEWSRLLYPPDLYRVVLIGFGGIFLLALTFFILNPFKKLTGILRNINWEAMRGASAMKEEKVKPEEAALQGAASAEGQGMLDGDRPLPFSFLRERHIPEVAFLLKDSPSSDAAIIANYLSPEMATRLIECFDEEKQAEVAFSLLEESEVGPQKVKDLEESLRSRLDYIVGGDEKLAGILDFTDEGLRNRVFDRLEGADGSAAARIRRKVKSFETVIAEMSPHAIQALFRQVDPTTLARLLKSSPPEVQERVTGALSEGAAQRIREEMDLSRPFSEERLKKEKFNVISVVRRMIKAGIIEEEA